MIILLYGQDSYRSREKLNQIIDKYKQTDSTQSGLFVFGLEDFELDKFNQAAREQSFFSSKKLIVLKGLLTKKFPADSRKKFIDYLEDHKDLFSSKDAVIIFWQEGAVLAGDALFKFLTQKKLSVKKEEFKPSSDSESKKWVKEKLGSKLKINPKALDNLILYSSNELWRLDNEVKKLKSYKVTGEISVQDIDFMVSGAPDLNIFQATDALGQKDMAKAARSFKALLEKGEDGIYLFSMIVYQFRNLLKVKSLSNENQSSASVLVAKKLKMHPFVVQKTLAQARNFTMPELKEIYKELLDLDIKIKTGKIEPGLGIELILYRLNKK